MRICSVAVVFGFCLCTAFGEPQPDLAGYRAVWNDELNAAIDARIERCRKADAAASGFEPGTHVHVEQMSHEFLFGAHIFNFDQLGRDDWNDAYKATFTNLFNAATIAFYWRDYEPVEGQVRFADGPHDGAAFWKAQASLTPEQKGRAYVEWRRPAPDPVLAFCRQNGISAHGHAIAFVPYSPDWITNVADKARLDALYEGRIRLLAEHYGDRIDQWDVVNESTNARSPFENPNDLKNWMIPGMKIPDDYTYRCFKWAERAFPPSVRLAINEAGVVKKPYLPFAGALLARGAKIDVVGVQMHIFKVDELMKVASGVPCTPNWTSWDPQDQMAAFREADKLGRPIHISEITIPAPDDSPAGQEVQARLFRDNYRLWFSWPSIYRITCWNLVDYTYYKESLASGLYTKDMKPKAAYRALDRLINHEWKTRLDAVADDAGRISFRGFKGRYKLVWQDVSGKTQSRTLIVK